MEVTSQPLATAALHIREPKNPFPPQTISFFVAAMVHELLKMKVSSETSPIYINFLI
jgi:hypothetical protein